MVEGLWKLQVWCSKILIGSWRTLPLMPSDTMSRFRPPQSPECRCAAQHGKAHCLSWLRRAPVLIIRWTGLFHLSISINYWFYYQNCSRLVNLLYCWFKIKNSKLCDSADLIWILAHEMQIKLQSKYLVTWMQAINNAGELVRMSSKKATTYWGLYS